MTFQLADRPLPMDKSVSHGRLSNGLEYYIRHNQRPKNRAELRLVIKVGSIVEDEDQLGLAHLVEHMAFNGSDNFKARELVEYFESIGMRFGAHLNAHTSPDETIYKLQIPTDDEEILQKSFLILRDWASNLIFLPEEIERERKVALEEWRQSLGAMSRVSEQLYPLVYFGSRYVSRRVVGTKESLETFEHDALKRFYRDWYRPDLMAVVIVGDVDPTQMESFVQEHFSSFASPSNSRERVYADIPKHEEPIHAVIHDQELTQSRFVILSKIEDPPMQSLSDYYRECMMEVAFHGMNERLQLKSQERATPFLGAKVGRQMFNRDFGSDVLYSVIPHESYEECVKEIAKELRRFQTFGLTEEELKRAKKRHLSSLEVEYEERDSTHSRMLITELIRSFTQEEAIPGIEFERTLTHTILPTISLEEVNAFLKDWLKEESQVIYITGGEADMPSKDDLVRWLAETKELEIHPPQEEEASSPLLHITPTAGEVVSKMWYEELDMHEWILSNGSKVWLKATTFQSNSVIYTSQSRGGYNQSDTEDLVSMVTAAPLAFRSGVGMHSLGELQKILSGVQMSLIPNISLLSHGFSGGGTHESLLPMFQLQHLFAVHPRFEEDAFFREKELRRARLLNRHVEPRFYFSEEFQRLWWQRHPRHMPWTVETLSKMDLARSATQYRRLLGPAPQNLVLIGNLDFQQLESHLSQYIASLPSPVEYVPRKHGTSLLQEAVYKEIFAGSEPLAIYRLGCFIPCKTTMQERIALLIFSEYINVSLRKKMREELGDVYSVYVDYKDLIYPESGSRLTIEFTCEPKKLQDLRTLLKETLLEHVSKVPAEKELMNVRTWLLRDFEVHIRENDGWMSFFLSSLRRGDPPKNILRYPELVKGVSPDLIFSLAPRLYDPQRAVELAMLPKKE